MKLVIVPRGGFKTIEVNLNVKFGARDETTEIQTLDGWRSLPQGTAHFLEHRIFESKGEHLSKYFAQRGATINAGTGESGTNYYFSTIREFPELLKYFLHFIQDYHDTDTGIKKESGIILREYIRRYEGQRSKMNRMMLQTAFPNSHLSRETLGNETTILNMKKRDLQLAFDQYYRPSNIALTIVGNVNVEQTVALVTSIEEAYPYRDPLPSRKLNENIHITGKAYFHESKFEINIPENHFYIKFIPHQHETGYETNQRKNTIMNYVRKLLLNSNSPLYLSWQKKGLLTSSLTSSQYSSDDYYWLFKYEAHTQSPQDLFEALKTLFNQTWDDVTLKPLFTTIKNSLIGGVYTETDNLYDLADSVVDQAINNEPYLYYLTLLNNTSFEDVKAFYERGIIFDLHYFHFTPIKSL